jgi:hypothetical protein
MQREFSDKFRSTVMLLTIDKNDVTFPHTLFSQHSGQDFYFFQELVISESLLTPSYRRVPDNCCRLTTSILNVPVNAIEGGRDFSIGKPGPIHVRNPALECFFRCCQHG